MTNSLPTVIKLLAKSLEVSEESITGQTELESLGADSLTVVELIVDLEEEFNIQVEDQFNHGQRIGAQRFADRG